VSKQLGAPSVKLRDSYQPGVNGGGSQTAAFIYDLRRRTLWRRGGNSNRRCQRKFPARIEPRVGQLFGAIILNTLRESMFDFASDSRFAKIHQQLRVAALGTSSVK
jgi:hypothetical protein